MFYLLQREKELNLHPRFFGPKLLDTLTAQLRAEVSPQIFKSEWARVNEKCDWVTRCYQVTN